MLKECKCCEREIEQCMQEMHKHMDVLSKLVWEAS